MHLSPILTQLILEREYQGKAGAGVLFICTKTKRILLGKRSEKCSEPHTWANFGGKIEAGETPEEGAKREVKEEAGFTGKMILIKAFTFKEGKKFTYTNYIGLVFDEFEPKLNDETDEARWMTYDELKALPDKHFGLKAMMRACGSLLRKHTKPKD